jgi:hypothetical protein
MVLSVISIVSSVMLYESIQEENRLKDIIAGYETKINNVEERNVRITSYTNHLLMTLEADRQAGN